MGTIVFLEDERLVRDARRGSAMPDTESVACSVCGGRLVFEVEGPYPRTVRCSKCGNVTEVVEIVYADFASRARFAEQRSA